jgi:mRNA-degrading endonuclease toxin of MazEF toxin-antitoxin module
LAELPLPVPGTVIRYAYLWKREADAGQVEGRKHRPCAIVVCVEHHEGEQVVTVAPITRTRPRQADQAVELTAATRRRLGLGAQPNWIMATEVNSFLWPGPDLVPMQKGEFVYGELPAVVFRELIAKILRAGAPAVKRSE